MSFQAGDLRKPSGHRSIEGLADVRANGRVLNLSTITREFNELVKDGTQQRKGLFTNNTLNQTIIVKHNIRENERQLFARARPVATKIILPIDANDLSLGAVAFMLGERQAAQILRDRMGLHRSSEDPTVHRDLRLLEILDTLATLDPFIVRERLSLEGIELPEAFAAVQLNGDHALHDYIKAQLAPLVRLAMVGQKSTASGARALDILLDGIFHGNQNGKGELLRLALCISPDKWPAALYTWKAALFYEYRVRNFEPRFQRFLSSLQRVKLYGFTNAAPAEIIMKLRYDLLSRALRSKSQLDRLLTRFNQAYRNDLIGQGTPDAFREYLLSLQDKLYDFGVIYGVLEQIVGYWEYWFISRGMTAIPADFFMEISRDLLNAADATHFDLGTATSNKATLFEAAKADINRSFPQPLPTL